MARKPQQYTGYSEAQTELAEKVLLEVWASLGEFRKEMVLVGGLVPRYLGKSFSKSRNIPPHYGTMDVDLGISLAVANRNTYGAIRETIVDRLGFRPGLNEKGRKQRHSFIKTIAEHNTNIDFLTAVYSGPDNSLMREIEEEISAIQVKGLGLALLDPLQVEIKGEMLSGELTTEVVNVCRPIPFVFLKSIAFADRREPKDVYDLIYVMNNSGGNPLDLASEIRAEEKESPFWPEFVECLKTHFESPQHSGPARYARFLDEPTQAIQAFAAVQEFLRALG